MATEFLREAREAKGLSLSEIAAQTRISPTILQRIERGDFKGVPAGLYVRAYLKAYSSAVGLDPETTLRTLDPLLPRADDSFNTIVQTFVTKKPPAEEPEPPVVHEAGAEPMARVTRLPTPASLSVRTDKELTLPPTPRVRLFTAAILDIVLVGLVDLGLIYLSASMCGVSVPEILRLAAPAMAMLCGTVTLSYFTLLGGVAGRTWGTRVLRISILESPDGPMDLGYVSRRTGRFLVREISALLGLRVWEPIAAGNGPQGGGGRSEQKSATLTAFPDRIRSA